MKTRIKCHCGHKKDEHSLNLTECYVIKHIKGSHYKCTCNGFKKVINFKVCERCANIEEENKCTYIYEFKQTWCNKCMINYEQEIEYKKEQVNKTKKKKNDKNK